MKMLALLLALFTALPASTQPLNILTKSYDVTRSGQNTAETILTPTAVRAKGMRKITTIPVVGDEKGEEAQPLILNGIMFLPSMANVIRAVNAVDGTGVWQTAPLCAPIPSTRQLDMWGTNSKFGFMSTGVIDPDTSKLYQVAFCSKDGSGSFDSITQRMFVVDVRTGVVLNNVLLEGTSNGLRYSDSPRKQRSALLLWKQNGVKFVIVLAGSFSETGSNATGWLLGFDTYDNKFKPALATRAGGWMSSQGPSEDMATGLIYFGLGNGAFNGVTTFGESSLQVRLTPPTATTAARFDVLRAWAPFSDASRTCANQQLTQPLAELPNKMAGMSAPTNAVVPGGVMPMPSAPCSNAWGDQDANLFGKLLLDVHKYMGGGKDGVVWMIDTNKFPSTQPADFGNPKLNCAKVALYQPGWNLGMDSCPTRLADLNRFPGGKTRHIHSTPATYTAPDGTHYELFMAENSPLQAWRVNADGTMSYVARGVEIASAQSGGVGGMPGGFPTVANRVAWVSVPDRDANRGMSNGRLIAYDLTALDNIAATQGIIPTISTSESYVFNKFMNPVVWNGQVYMTNSSGGVDVYGLGGAQ